MSKRGYDPGDIGSIEEIAAERLTPRQKRFADGIALGLSQRAAFDDAGYKASTDHAAQVAACQLRHHPVISAEIQRRSAAISQRVDITRERVLAETARVAFADTTRAVYVENGSVHVRDTDELSLDDRAAISEISETNGENGRSLKIKFHSKTEALNSLAKHLRLHGDEQPAATTQVFVLIAPTQAESPEKWAELVQQQAHAIAPPQPGAA